MNSSRSRLRKSQYVLCGNVGADETAIDAGLGRVLVKVDPRYFRPTEADLLIGASKARAKLGGKHRVSFDEVVAEMVAAADLKNVALEKSRVLTAAD
jgi:GDPmannose 4,6-dehydratase